MNLFRTLALALSMLLATSPTYAQWQAPNHSVPFGRGAGVTGFGSAAPGTAGLPLTSNGASADPSFQTLPTAGGGTGTSNATNSANDVLVSNGTNGNFVSTALLTVLNKVCTAAPSACNFFFGYVSVVWYGAVCDGSTNDSAALQAAINAVSSTGANIFLPRGAFVNCVFNTPLDFRGKNGVRVTGGSTISTSSSCCQQSGLTYTGGAAARAIDLRDTAGISFSGVAFGWNNSAFTGIMVDCGSQTPGTNVSFYCTVTQSNFGPGGGATGNVTCINVSEAIEWVISYNGFNGCNVGIHGQNILGQSTVGLIEHNQFFKTGTAPILECGESWTIVSNTFEQTASNGSVAFANSFSLPCKGISFISNWFGDASAAGNWIAITANGASITGGRMAAGTAASTAITIAGGGGYAIHGIEFDAFTTAIVFGSTPVGANVNGNSFIGVTNETSGACTNCSLTFNSP